MKADRFVLINESVRNLCIAKIKDLPVDGKTQVVISAAAGKSTRQRGLQFLWYTNVAKSGMGGRHEESVEACHIASKYRWAIPIFVRDDEHFSEIYTEWMKMYGDDSDRMFWFADKMVHTEKFTVSQMAEFLTNFQEYYLNHGFPLVNPDDLGLLRMA